MESSYTKQYNWFPMRSFSLSRLIQGKREFHIGDEPPVSAQHDIKAPYLVIFTPSSPLIAK